MPLTRWIRFALAGGLSLVLFLGAVALVTPLMPLDPAPVHPFGQGLVWAPLFGALAALPERSPARFRRDLAIAWLAGLGAAAAIVIAWRLGPGEALMPWFLDPRRLEHPGWALLHRAVSVAAPVAAAAMLLALAPLRRTASPGAGTAP